MATRVLITIDTELTWRHFDPGGDWRGNLALSFDPAGVGVPFQLETLNRHGLKACFFVDPMPALAYGLEPVQRMVEPILAAGQEVQLHLHSFWEGVARGAHDDAVFELTDLDEAAQTELIATARDLLVRAGAPAPIAFRAGSYAADQATIAALRRLGFRYDSSHNGSHHPHPSALPLDPAQIAPIALDRVIEIPVTQLRPGRRALRHLQICAVSFAEMRDALNHAADAHHPVATLVSHSFELATRNGRRPNQTVRRRFERLCRFLADHRERLPTAWFADLDALPLDSPAAPLAPSAVRTIARMAEQIWANTVYERAR